MSQPDGAIRTADRRSAPVDHVTLLSDQDLYLFNEGTHNRLHEHLGAHLIDDERGRGTYFAVWAPNAEQVAVMGDFNGWDRGRDLLRPRGASGIWESLVADVERGARYKFHIVSRSGYRVEKSDPFATYAEAPPRTASVVWDTAYDWNDGAWLAGRAQRNALDAPMSVYELHIGSWRRAPEDGRPLSYRELAETLPDYLGELGFTHGEVMPVMEHPFYGSWCYQVTGFFAPTSRYGTPQDFMHLIDRLHGAGIGVILDWVPSHFPSDEHGLGYFDGTHLYEHADPRQGFHPDWGSLIFNYGRAEVRSFLLSNALYWLERFHADGLRVDAVASMLYLDYSRQEGEWIPNRYGGRENIEAIEFLRRFNQDVFGYAPGVQTIAEESTSWPMVSRPTYVGGLGFGLKWDMGWMHDTLDYFSRDPIHRRFHHDQLTFRSLYAFTENFCLPLSHDEVVHGKGSLIGKMPGDEWQRFANLRLLFGYQYSQPGKKLLFMGDEFGQKREWNHDDSLDWHLVGEGPLHRGVQAWVGHLNRLYAGDPALHELDTEPAGFEWIEGSDSEYSVLSYLRRGRSERDVVLVCCNFTPQPRHNYRVGVPRGGWWREAANSDATEYGGSGQGNMGGVEAAPLARHGRPYSLNLTLPPLGVVLLRHEATEG
ncbi:1,4-alpha-glucan branching protein GlgB [soil metagenome]